jgi:hypothetical protein
MEEPSLTVEKHLKEKMIVQTNSKDMSSWPIEIFWRVSNDLENELNSLIDMRLTEVFEYHSVECKAEKVKVEVCWQKSTSNAKAFLLDSHPGTTPKSVTSGNTTSLSAGLSPSVNPSGTVLVGRSHTDSASFPDTFVINLSESNKALARWKYVYKSDTAASSTSKLEQKCQFSIPKHNTVFRLEVTVVMSKKSLIPQRIKRSFPDYLFNVALDPNPNSNQPSPKQPITTTPPPVLTLVGHPKSGKSSFVNAIYEACDFDERPADEDKDVSTSFVHVYNINCFTEFKQPVRIIDTQGQYFNVSKDQAKLDALLEGVSNKTDLNKDDLNTTKDATNKPNEVIILINALLLLEDLQAGEKSWGLGYYFYGDSRLIKDLGELYDYIETKIRSKPFFLVTHMDKVTETEEELTALLKKYVKVPLPRIYFAKKVCHWSNAIKDVHETGVCSHKFDDLTKKSYVTLIKTLQAT